MEASPATIPMKANMLSGNIKSLREGGPTIDDDVESMMSDQHNTSN